MDRNEGAKRCCFRLGCGLRNDTLKNPYMDPDQLTTLHTAKLLITSTTATTYIDDFTYRKHFDLLNSLISTIFFRINFFNLYISILITIKYIYNK